MQFSEGQVVVHPHHGPATVTAITTRVVRGEPRKYLKLEVLGTNLAVGVPLAGATEAGVRPVVGGDELAAVFSILTAPSPEEEQGWSRRIKANVERLRTGDLHTIAGLVRDLVRRQDDKGLSLGEKDLLRDARGPFVTEVALALDLAEAEAEAVVEAAIRDGVVPPLPTAELATAV